MNMLKIALRKIKESDKATSEKKAKKKDNTALEQAMQDFNDATTASERAAAFTAALELAKSE